jgi:hypothetical protein
MDASGSTRRWWRAGIVAILLVGIAAVGVVLALDNGGPDDATRMNGTMLAQVAAVQEGCQQWQTDQRAADRIPEWCSSMSDWMCDRMVQGWRAPHPLWGDLGEVRANCRQWLVDNPRILTGSDDRCGGMIAWMQTHMRYWGKPGYSPDWMMRGSR